MFHSVCVMMLISQDLLAAHYVMALAFSQHGPNYVEVECVFAPLPSCYGNSWNLPLPPGSGLATK